MGDIDDLLSRQSGVIARRQMKEGGLTSNDIRRLLRREFALVHPGVYLNHTGQPTQAQRAWAACLYLAPAALCRQSALQLTDEVIHVAVARHRSRTAPPGVRLHRCHDLERVARWNLSPPRVTVEHAVIDLAASARTPTQAIGHLTGAVNSRRTTAARLELELAHRRRVPGRQLIEAAIVDIRDGTNSALEHGYLTLVERAHGLPTGTRQARSVLAGRNVYHDVDYGVFYVLVELDGFAFHRSTTQRNQDLRRDLLALTRGQVTVRISWGQVYDTGCETAAVIATLLNERGWSGRMRPCPRCPSTGAAH